MQFVLTIGVIMNVNVKILFIKVSNFIIMSIPFHF